MVALISIGKAAKVFGVHPDTLRNWEKAGKIKSVRTKGNHRRFEESDIKHCRMIEFWESVEDSSKCKEWFNFFLNSDNLIAALHDYIRCKLINETDILRFMLVSVLWCRSK